MPTDYFVMLKYREGIMHYSNEDLEKLGLQKSESMDIFIQAYQENGENLPTPTNDLGRLVLNSAIELFKRSREKGINEPTFSLSAGSSI